MKSLYENFKKSKKNRVVRSQVGLTKKEFYALLASFIDGHSILQQDRLKRGEIKMLPKGGTKGFLFDFEIKLFFVMYYLKNYPTFDMLGSLFGFSGGHAHNHLTALLPVLQKALSLSGVLPADSAASFKEIRQLFENSGVIIIDCTECRCARPGGHDRQKEYYSGKKGQHTVKPLVVSTAAKYIIFIGLAVPGSVHDYALMKKIFDPSLPWFENVEAYFDLGFFGAQKDYGGTDNMHLPHKRQKKSKNNPNPALNDIQKAENKKLAAIRIAVEHAIGGMKHFHCLTHRIRNHLGATINYFFHLCAGLHNFKLSSLSTA